MAKCGLKTDARTLRVTDNRTLPSAVSLNTVATTTTTTSEITKTGRFHIAQIEKRQKSGTSAHTEDGKVREIRREEEKTILATSTVVSKGTGMRTTGTGRPTSPGTTTMATTTSSGTGGTINGAARKWKTQAADDRTHTQNRIMIIGQTGTVRWTTASLGEGYEWSYDNWGRTFDEQRTELLYSGAESRHTHRNSQSATVSCQAWGVHWGQTGGRVRSREGDQSNPGRDAHHITNPRNTVPGSRPYNEVVKSRTAPVITGQTEETVGRSTDGESAEEGTEGQLDVDSLIENNAASNPSAFDAGGMQNNADSNADHPLTSNDAVPGDALSINATPDTASSSITAARDGSEEDAVTGMPLTTPTPLDHTTTAPEWNATMKMTTPRPSSKQRRREFKSAPSVA